MVPDLTRDDDGLPLTTEVLFDLEATVQARQDIGTTPFGRRRIYVVGGGSFAGARLRGELLPGSADWLVRGADGTSEIDVRATLRTDDGCLVFMRYSGIYYADPDVKRRMDDGADVRPSEYYFRTTPRFETGAAGYGWLNRVVAVGVGRRTASGIAYRVYQVT